MHDHNPLNCDDGVCTDPVKTFCDVDGSVAGHAHTCIEPTCTAGMPVACQGESAVACNASGTDFDVTPCDQGCNAMTMVCNSCDPSTVACVNDTVMMCGANGIYEPGPLCAAGCVAMPAPHCGYLEPKYLPDVCDAAVTAPNFTVITSGNFDTSLDASCTGGVVAQTGGPDLCVVRAKQISIDQVATLAVTGPRALALVADDDVTIAGVLDVSANGDSSGPGGGLVYAA